MTRMGKWYVLVLISIFMLYGCASSHVSRDVASNVDMGVQNAKGLVDGVSESSIADSYQNASQRAKGAMLGGAAGAVGGSLVTAIGALPGGLVGAVFGASYGSYIDRQATLEDQLKNRGANIVILGDQILIVLPSARLFRHMTASIKPDAYSTIELTAIYINRFTKTLVKISAHTAALSSPEVDFALSQKQAEAVSRMLQASGVDARILYASGYGGTQLVQGGSNWEGNDNYRIEITLEKLYV